MSGGLDTTITIGEVMENNITVVSSRAQIYGKNTFGIMSFDV